LNVIMIHGYPHVHALRQWRGFVFLVTVSRASGRHTRHADMTWPNINTLMHAHVGAYAGMGMACDEGR
jgi:hypothetical protein